MAYILIAEDEAPLNRLLEQNLQLVGHRTRSVFDGRTALAAAQQESFDLALMDIMMPGLSGLEVKARLPQELPVIFVTAKTAVTDQLLGLQLGADDYITKPFDILVLLARVEAVLRRTKKNTTQLCFGACSIDLESRTVQVDGVPVELTPQEYSLLEVLALNRNLALSREKLLELAWSMDFDGGTRTVDMHIQKLRKKLRLEEHIRTVYKYGYRLESSPAPGDAP